MADFAPPSTPPPPKVPEGWKAVWNEKYKEWFYVNIHTKKSQWDKPTEPVYPPDGEDEEPDGPPPYDPKKARAVGPEKSSLGSNNPFGHSGAGGSGDPTASDEELARRLQAEEDARRPDGSRGEADAYFNDGPSGPSSSQGGHANPSNDLPPRPEQQQKRGLFGKLLGKNKTSSSQQQQQQYYPPQQPYYPQGPPPGPGYGYPPPGGYYPPPGPGGYYGGGYDRPQRQGLGAGGAAALGLGGGLLGGMLIGETLADAGDGYGDGGDYGGGGGDFGGGA